MFLIRRLASDANGEQRGSRGDEVGAAVNRITEYSDGVADDSCSQFEDEEP
jgi:hypothetical protein